MLLLHTCCAPCSAAILEYLAAGQIHPVLFFFNPNIYPEAEYEKRKTELQRYARSQNITFIDGDYDRSLWAEAVKGLENQPERGLRCLECFKVRLLATARFAHEKGFDRIATTLASSRWKNLEQIAEAGHWAAAQFPGLTFWAKNWRKDGLSARRRILLKENGFYNQQYCGCEYSLKPCREVHDTRCT
ncbi:MAG: epoxyqueuosine reductase QueH [Candidatus Symbiothrix sp.]|jgi:predicted adenine nucleotide alpha hydrolase (AANH) superfamily ATPase|nr:epoxyqueuosine reductase QueH [Candidatus Symbiothrix sp.]